MNQTCERGPNGDLAGNFITKPIETYPDILSHETSVVNAIWKFYRNYIDNIYKVHIYIEYIDVCRIYIYILFL